MTTVMVKNDEGGKNNDDDNDTRGNGRLTNAIALLWLRKRNKCRIFGEKDRVPPFVALVSPKTSILIGVRISHVAKTRNIAWIGVFPKKPIFHYSMGFRCVREFPERGWFSTDAAECAILIAVFAPS